MIFALWAVAKDLVFIAMGHGAAFGFALWATAQNQLL
jgi:hypothetical protein